MWQTFYYLFVRLFICYLSLIYTGQMSNKNFGRADRDQNGSFIWNFRVVLKEYFDGILLYLFKIDFQLL